jgi:hypothetical protein
MPHGSWTTVYWPHSIFNHISPQQQIERESMRCQSSIASKDKVPPVLALPLIFIIGITILHDSLPNNNNSVSAFMTGSPTAIARRNYWIIPPSSSTNVYLVKKSLHATKWGPFRSTPLDMSSNKYNKHDVDSVSFQKGPQRRNAMATAQGERKVYATRTEQEEAKKFYIAAVQKWLLSLKKQDCNTYVLKLQ